MSNQEENLYDIFAGDLRTKPRWLVAVSGLSSAVAVMNRLATKRPGSYFVLDEGAHIVAQIDRREVRLSA